MPAVAQVQRKRGRPKSEAPFPPAGTQLARIIECLEAEPASLQEVADYLNTTCRRATGLVQKLRERGIVRLSPAVKWELVDPEAVSVFYGD